jgi:hypothetical protein
MARVEEWADARMVPAGDRLCFALEPLAPLRPSGDMSGKNFEGDDSIEAGITGFVHLAHSTHTDRRKNFVRP